MMAGALVGSEAVVLAVPAKPNVVAKMGSTKELKGSKAMAS